MPASRSNLASTASFPAAAVPRRAAVAGIPRFALYGEQATPGQELLHIEEVQSRSRLYHWEIDPHVHQGLFQVLWVRRGTAEVVLDERREAARGPAAIVIPPGVVHGFRFEPETDGLVLTLSARFLVEGEFQTVGEAFRSLFAAPRVVIFDAADGTGRRLDGLLHELAAEFALPANADSPVTGWLARAVVWRLARERSDARTAPGTAGRRRPELFTRFLLLIEEHFLEHWPVERYASRLGLSPARLNRLTRAEAGRSALDLVHERLTREACRRLAYIAAPSASLAHELGFEDPAYFSRFFKRQTGQTPHRWRRLQAGGSPAA